MMPEARIIFLRSCVNAGSSFEDKPIDLTESEIDALMQAIHTSHAFRRLVFLMDWDTLVRAVRTVMATFRGSDET